VKRRFYLKQHKRVNTFIPGIDSPGFIEMNESVASFLIFFADKPDESRISESE
jgi:hypothetical protein